MTKPTKPVQRPGREQTILNLAKPCCVDGETEIDQDARISEGDDNGAYVQAWVWVDFAGTELDKLKAKPTRRR